MAVLPSADSATETPCLAFPTAPVPDQLVALLGPNPTTAGEDPHRSGPPVVERPSYDGGVAVLGQRDGETLGGASNRTGADQLVALLRPDVASACVDPRRPGDLVVGKPAHDGGVAVGGQRDGPALLAESSRECADQLRSLLEELRRRRLRLGLTCGSKRTCDHEKRGQTARQRTQPLPACSPRKKARRGRRPLGGGPTDEAMTDPLGL
jgi:hypothetical protein